MLLKRIEKHINLEFLKEDFRKIGINLITAGPIGLFVTHIVNPTFVMWLGSAWVFVLGAMILFWALRK